MSDTEDVLFNKNTDFLGKLDYATVTTNVTDERALKTAKRQWNRLQTNLARIQFCLGTLCREQKK